MLEFIFVLVLDQVEDFSYHSETINLFNVLNFALQVLIGKRFNLVQLFSTIFIIVDPSPIS